MTIAAHIFKGKTVAVFGLGRSAASRPRTLWCAGGADVLRGTTTPAAPPRPRSDGVAGRRSARGRLVRRSTASCCAPGVPLTHPEPHWRAEAGTRAGRRGHRRYRTFCRARAGTGGTSCVAITGTNGKSTTTALIGASARRRGRDGQIGGNIGTAVLAWRRPSPADGLRDRVVVLPDRPDAVAEARCRRPPQSHARSSRPARRHGGITRRSRRVSLRSGRQHAIAVIGVDDEPSRRSQECETRFSVPISVGCKRRCWCGPATRVIDRRAGRSVADLAAWSLRGAHNGRTRRRASLPVPRHRGQGARRGLERFPGLAHRMEQVGSPEKSCSSTTARRPMRMRPKRLSKL